MKELVGKNFKRNKYGESSWIDTITEVAVKWHHKGVCRKVPVVQVKGSLHWYNLDEIVIVWEKTYYDEILEKVQKHKEQKINGNKIQKTS